MKTLVFSVYDSKAEFFGTPFFSQTRGMAIRMFCDAAQDKNTMLAKHPNDFILFEVGTFDDSTGVLEAVKPVNLGMPILEQEPIMVDLGKMTNGKSKEEDKKIEVVQ